MTLSCYLPHLTDWPFRTGDKITVNIDNGTKVMTAFSAELAGDEWKAVRSNFSYEFSKHTKDSKAIEVKLTFAKNFYNGNYWCGSVSALATARSPSVKLNIAGM